MPALDTGNMLPDSDFYIKREVDNHVENELQTKGTTIVIKGYRQAGKSSLLSRLHSFANEKGIRSCFLDFQCIEQDTLKNLDRLCIAIARIMSDELEIDKDPEDVWTKRVGAKLNLSRYLEKSILTDTKQTIQLLFDEVDIVFGHPTCTELFSTIRYWHNRRATDSKGRWRQLNLVIAHATDPTLWIPDNNQSPFNVGTRVFSQ